jgi:PAS domain-containing protein
MGEKPQQTLQLIMARELAEVIASPVFLVDAKGTLVFYNEPAEEVLGLRYAEAGPLAPGDWGTRWQPETLDGEPIALETLPLTIAVNQLRPAHMAFRIIGVDGVKRTIEATAFPLLARADEYAGAVAIFWQVPDGNG